MAGRRILTAVSVLLLLACTKEVPTITPPVDEWVQRNQISGEYKVYDTLGNYLYMMQITRIKDYSTNYSIADSLRFENFDDEFSFTVAQYKWANYVMGIRIGSHDTLYDGNNKRWRLGSALYEDYNNYSNDTIRLRFQKTNINYWIEDVVPYYACDCKQIAVKQH
ncbi:hypothetical protein GCM10009118_22820 [Wandonia haliotis]|uniref:Lipoprotein n=2 Tax=Wandonia haliotis TaxID=574963 RepID=A0ABN1MRW1_9FLAO